jgi:hypothetical protein
MRTPQGGTEVVIRRRPAGKQPITLACIGGMLLDAMRNGLPADTPLMGASGWRGQIRRVEVTGLADAAGRPLEEALANALGQLPAVTGGAGVYALLSHLERSGYLIAPKAIMDWVRHRPDCEAGEVVPGDCTCGLAEVESAGRYPAEP